MRNILLVDDVKTNRSIMQGILSKLFDDINYLHASNGVEAIKCINENDIDLVILDLIMPEKDGFEVLEELKDNPEKNVIPIIVNSSLDDMRSIQRALKLGAYDYFVKPIKEQDIEMVLLIKVRNALLSYERFKEINKINKHMELEMRFANFFQKSLLTDYRDTDIASMYVKHNSTGEFLGHLYDCIQINDTFWFIAADVSGHGTVAAMITSMIKGAVRSYVTETSSPGDVLNRINNMFCKISEDGYQLQFSAFIGMIKGGKFYYSNAGYEHPVLFDVTKNEVKVLKKNGIMLGVFEDIDYSVSSIEVSKGSTIMLYSDEHESSENMDLYGYYLENQDELFETMNEGKEVLADKILSKLDNKKHSMEKEHVVIIIEIK